MKARWLVEFLVLVCLFGLRVYQLEENLFFDYDSAKNYLVIKEMAEGNFTNLFHHVSPVFFLFFLPFFQIFSSATLLVCLNAFLNLLAVWVLVNYFSNRLKIRFREKLLLLFLVGSSCFLVQTSRTFSIENMTLLLFVSLGIWYYQYLSNNHSDTKKLYLWSGCLSLLLILNYKAFLLIPFLILPILLVGKWRNKHAFIVGIVCFLPWLVSPIASYFLGLHPLQLFKTFYVCAIEKNVNPTVHLSKFEFDIFFYVKYIFSFENFLIFPTFLAFLFSVKGKVKFKSFVKNDTKAALLWTMLLFLCMMSILQKAPRGILYLYPFFYLFSFYFFHNKIRNKGIQTMAVVGMIIINFYQIGQNVLPYIQSGYKEMAKAINRLGEVKIASTVGNGVFPWLSDQVDAEVIFVPHDQDALLSKGYDYLLVDDFFRTAGVDAFQAYDQLVSEFETTSLSLKSPFLYLEHCEFSGRSYEEALEARHKSIKAGNYRVKLVKIKK